MGRILHDYINDLRREFTGYTAARFRKDAMAGVTVAAVALPLALAFGIGSGADAAAGLITTIVAAFVIGALSGTSYQLSGPTGAMSAILMPLVARHGMKGLFAATAIAGVILIIAGLARFGKLVYFLPAPIISGFTSGVAIVIAVGQFGSLLGVKLSGEDTLDYLIALFRDRPVVNFYSMALGGGVIALMAFWPKRWARVMPASLVGVIAATVLTALLDLPVETVGAIPRALIHETRFRLTDLRSIQFDTMLLPAISIAALGMIESLLCGASAGRMKNERMNADRELIAQGIGNLALPFFGGVPATAALARTSVAIKAGSQTRLAGLIQGLVLVVSMFLLSGYLSLIPMPALAGVLIVTAWRMNEWHSIQFMVRHKFKSTITKYLITLLATVIFDLTIAIALGLFFSIVLFVIQISALDVTVSEVNPERLGVDIHTKRHTQIVYITGAVFFGSLGQLQAELSRAEGGALIISMRGVPLVDDSALAVFLEFCEQRIKAGGIVLFACVQPKVKTMFDRAGLTDKVGQDAYYANAKDAIISLGDRPSEPVLNRQTV